MAKTAQLVRLHCPSCKHELEDYPLTCPGCGADLIQTDLRAPELLAKSINRKENSVFFYVSPLKLVVMSIATFGLYELFWFYKNWYYVNEHTNHAVWPLMRSIFRG